jgi:glycosyltransferase involved in cell wall biosynthesis
MKFSVVIPTYNRRHVLDRAIASALPLVRDGVAELIVVDDASQDGTTDHVRAKYSDLLESGSMRLCQGLVNEGVTAAKNRGASLATGDWLIFLDSDDELVVDGSRVLRDVCCPQGGAPYPIVFFRCQTRDGRLIGAAPLEDHLVNARDCLVAWRWGECLPVLRRTAFHKHPYDADLRGHEAIAFGRLVREFGPALVAGVVARVYDDTGTDRLSTPQALRARAYSLGRGHARIALEFWRELGVRSVVVSLAKAAAYFGIFLQARLRQTVGSLALGQ